MSAKLRAALGCGLIAVALSSAAHAQYAMREVVGKPEASKPVGFEVFLPLRNPDALEALSADLHNPASPNFHHWLTPKQFAERFGPAKASLDRAAAALRARGFAVTPHSRSLHVTGTPAQVESTFATHMANVRSPAGHILPMAMTHMRVPSAVAAEGGVIVGLNGLEMHAMHKVVTRALPGGKADNRFSNTGTYYYGDLKQAYSYPAVNSTIKVNGKTERFDGTGVTLGVIIDSDVLDSDIKLLFNHEHYAQVAKKAAPTLFKRVRINGGISFARGDAFEASLDVQQEITGAPGAHVILYNLPELSDLDILDGYIRIVEDDEVDLVSASFGACEALYLPKYNGGESFVPTLRAYHEIFLQGNVQGITFLASSGDEAGKVCPSLAYFNNLPGVYEAGASTPASDPAVTGVGGTNLVTDYEPGTLNSSYAGENAWSDPEAPDDPYGLGTQVSGKVWGAGGGASAIFKKPKYQTLVTTRSAMRMTPDVGMQVGGCPNDATDFNAKIGLCNGGNTVKNGSGNTDRSAVVVAVGGKRVALIGTSVSSPEFAGAVAMLIQAKGRQGNLNEYIYAKAHAQAHGGPRVFHTMIPGYNGLIESNISPAYNVSTGVGTPIVNKFIGSTGPVAGVPQTPSNP